MCTSEWELLHPNSYVISGWTDVKVRPIFFYLLASTKDKYWNCVSLPLCSWWEVVALVGLIMNYIPFYLYSSLISLAKEGVVRSSALMTITV